jgi:predicted house-cleaning NTP pyrophosphatase (Maf/HAM1 superfamily)
MPQQPSLLLASTSIYRRELLSRLRLAFGVVAPDVDEAPVPLQYVPPTQAAVPVERPAEAAQ